MAGLRVQPKHGFDSVITAGPREFGLSGNMRRNAGSHAKGPDNAVEQCERNAAKQRRTAQERKKELSLLPWRDCIPRAPRCKRATCPESDLKNAVGLTIE